ncbi:uncharacterized protein LOC141885401 isoform X5 [Acropora palmata]
MLLNAGLSLSSQSLHYENEINGSSEERITRSGSLPDIPTCQVENSKEWQATRALKGSYSSKKHCDLDEELNINNLRELVIYHPIECNEDSDDNDDDNHDELTLNEINTLNTSNPSPVNKRKSRKRDSAALFDISLEDLCEPDYAGFLREKHSEKLWWCVLIDQHLCIFPSRDPDEVAYDVVIMPCCQISLDDRLMRTPVFRLTQSDMAPWVFVASNNDELKDWMKVLTIAASAGKKPHNEVSNSEEKQLCKPCKGPAMQSIVEEEEEIMEEEDALLPCFSNSEIISAAHSQVNGNSSKDDENISLSYVNGSPQDSGYVKELPEIPDLGELPQIPDEPNGCQFGEDVYEAVANLTENVNQSPGDEYQDDGFATDEFDSGSSDGGDISPNPQAQPVQQKAKKKKQFFHWLKKKGKKDKLFSSPKDGIALAGYAYKGNDSSKRWFLIREEKLFCYKNIKYDDPEMTVELKSCEIRAGEEEKSKLAIHVIRDNVSHLTLIAKSSKDWERWKKAFLIESGFIKLASPTESSSGVFDHEEEDGYATPVLSPDLEIKLQTSKIDKHALALQSTDKENKLEDPYTKIVSSTQMSNLKALSPCVSQDDLGPLPPIPPDLPEQRPSDKEESTESNFCSIENDEIYEEVSSSVPHADKVIKWNGLNTAGPGCPSELNSKAVDKSSKGLKLTAGIHKIADTITKTSKKKSFDKQETCAIADGVSDTDKVCYIDRQSPPENVVDEDKGSRKEGHEASVSNDTSDGYLVLREATDEEKEVELKVQQKIEALKRGHEGPRMNGKHEISQGILSKKSLYEANKQSAETKSESNGGVKKNETVIVKDNPEEETTENKGHIPRTRTDSDSYNPDKERQELEKTEKAFQEHAKQLKKDAGKKEKRPSLVALSRLNFEDPDSGQKSMENVGYEAKIENLQKEKEDLFIKQDNLKKRVSVAKDRKIFFSLSTSRSKATTDADKEFHESQCELAKTKKRLSEIENEMKNLKVMELRHQKTPYKNPVSSAFKFRGRKNSKECKLGSAEGASLPLVAGSTEFSSVETEPAQKGSVLSQIKVFELMKKT